MQPTQPAVLPEGSNRTQGRTAQDTNIMVAKLVAGIVKSTLGPKGMDKLLVDSMGDVTVTNDGVTILREMTIENPVAKMMVDIARTQESEVGDGTTTAVVLAGQLLNNAQVLLNKKVHPTLIARGYKIAAEEADRFLREIAQPMDVFPEQEKLGVLMNIAKTAMTGKGAEDRRDDLAKIVVEAIKQVVEDKEIDLDNIRVEKKEGGSVSDTQIIRGIVLDKARLHPNMPKSVADAKIAILDMALETKSLDMDARINITDPSQMTAFMNQEADMIKKIIDKIQESKANVVICGRGIDDASTHFLNKAGIMALNRVSREDLQQISRATSGKIVTDIEDLSSEDLGKAGLVEERFVGGSDMTYIEGYMDAKSVTIMVRGSTEQVTAEVKRAIEDALGDIATMVKDEFAVGGAGSPEIILSRKLREFAATHKGRMQLVIEQFAEAMEVIPETLAENAGLDPIDVMAELKQEVQTATLKFAWPGVNVNDGSVMDAWAEGVIEPLRVKTQAVSSAAEVAQMVLRIDDVIAIMNNPDQQKAQQAAMQQM